MTVCDSVDIRHIPRVQAESPDSRFQYRFQHLSDLHRKFVAVSFFELWTNARFQFAVRLLAPFLVTVNHAPKDERST